MQEKRLELLYLEIWRRDSMGQRELVSRSRSNELPLQMSHHQLQIAQVEGERPLLG